jgi:hypothetical protein
MVTYAQRLDSSSAFIHDTLEAVPAFDVQSLEFEVVSALRWDRWYVLNQQQRDSLQIGQIVRLPMSGRPMIRQSFNEQLRMLAWRKFQIKHDFEIGQTRKVEHVIDSVYELLLWAYYLDTASRDHWALIMVVGYGNEWKLPVALPVLRFSRPPRNVDVYQFLERFTRFGQGASKSIPEFFAPDLNRYSGQMQILDTHLREHTWRLIIGEAPTIFFMNNK